jgi:two-component sensor histidine kinase
MASQTFAAWAASIPEARRYVSESLDHLPADLCRTAALLVSELATNAVRHAGGRQFVVEIQSYPDEGRVWIGITDGDAGLPVLRAPAVTDENGRGMQLVSSLADRWGARRRRHTSEKTVWFELRYPLADVPD